MIAVRQKAGFVLINGAWNICPDMPKAANPVFIFSIFMKVYFCEDMNLSITMAYDFYRKQIARYVSNAFGT